jgi:SAM-dependent methyltransferase
MRPEASIYTSLEVSLADTNRLMRYYLEADPEIHLNLKGFDYAWITRSVAWREGMRVLDVGAGFSWLPSYLAKRFGCEMWAIDDFGESEPSRFWRRHRDPEEFIDSHPEIHYVRGRLGANGPSGLPEASFDCIYSASALEHVRPGQIRAVWESMDRLLRPGGTLVHALDIAFPSSRGAKHVALAWGYDMSYPLLPRSLRTRFAYETPLSYTRFVASVLPIRNLAAARRRMSVSRMVLDPEVAVEPLDYAVNRVIKDGDHAPRYYRVGSLLLRLQKEEKSDGRPALEERRPVALS